MIRLTSNCVCTPYARVEYKSSKSKGRGVAKKVNWDFLSIRKSCRDSRRIHVGMGREYEYERISGLTGLNG